MAEGVSIRPPKHYEMEMSFRAKRSPSILLRGFETAGIRLLLERCTSKGAREMGMSCNGMSSVRGEG